MTLVSDEQRTLRAKRTNVLMAMGMVLWLCSSGGSVWAQGSMIDLQISGDPGEIVEVDGAWLLRLRKVLEGYRRSIVMKDEEIEALKQQIDGERDVILKVTVDENSDTISREDQAALIEQNAIFGIELKKAEEEKHQLMQSLLRLQKENEGLKEKETASGKAMMSEIEQLKNRLAQSQTEIAQLQSQQNVQDHTVNDTKTIRANNEDIEALRKKLTLQKYAHAQKEKEFDDELAALKQEHKEALAQLMSTRTSYRDLQREWADAKKAWEKEKYEQHNQDRVNGSDPMVLRFKEENQEQLSQFLDALKKEHRALYDSYEQEVRELRSLLANVREDKGRVLNPSPNRDTASSAMRSLVPAGFQNDLREIRDKTQTSPPPLRIPVYPEAMINASEDSLGTSQRSDLQENFVNLEIMQDANQVFAWYKEAVQQKGWQIIFERQPGNAIPGMIKARDRGYILIISIHQGEKTSVVGTIYEMPS